MVKVDIQKVLVFNLTGHGLMDMSAYNQFLSGNLVNYAMTDEEVARNIENQNLGF